MNSPASPSTAAVYWTAFIGLFFDYYDLYLFVYLDRVLAAHFGLSGAQSSWLQFAGLASVGAGAIAFGYLADRFGRARVMLAVFAVYVLGIVGISMAWSYESLLVFRVLASLALGAEWGVSHAYLAERVSGAARYRLAALLQFSILGGLLAALAARYALPAIGWRGLFALSIIPIVVLSAVRGRALRHEDAVAPTLPHPTRTRVASADVPAFLLCLGLATLTIASGTINVFFAKELPQSVWYTIFFWANVAPGMLLGAALVRRVGVRQALAIYAIALVTLSLGCWLSDWPGRALAFALLLPLLNGIPFGLMGAYFNEMFSGFRTMMSGAAYNLGRIGAGFAPVLVAALGLHEAGRYFLFSAALGLGVAALALAVDRRAGRVAPVPGAGAVN